MTKQRNQQVKRIAQDALIPLAICSYCRKRGKPTRYKGDPRGNYWCIDHIVPLALGGEDALHNMTLACWDCNEKKEAELWTRRLDGKTIVTAASVRGEEEPFVWSFEKIVARNPELATSVIKLWSKSRVEKGRRPKTVRQMAAKKGRETMKQNPPTQKQLNYISAMSARLNIKLQQPTNAHQARAVIKKLEWLERNKV